MGTNWFVIHLPHGVKSEKHPTKEFGVLHSTHKKELLRILTQISLH